MTTKIKRLGKKLRRSWTRNRFEEDYVVNKTSVTDAEHKLYTLSGVKNFQYITVYNVYVFPQTLNAVKLHVNLPLCVRVRMYMCVKEITRNH